MLSEIPKSEAMEGAALLRVKRLGGTALIAVWYGNERVSVFKADPLDAETLDERVRWVYPETPTRVEVLDEITEFLNQRPDVESADADRPHSRRLSGRRRGAADTDEE